MSGNSIRDTFFEECEELLEALAEGLAVLEQSESDADSVNAVFRAVHSVKGGAGAFGFDRLVHFAHTFETVLDMVRSGSLALSEDLMSLFHRSSDHLSDQVAAERDGTEVNAQTESTLLTALEGFLGTDGGEEEFSFEAVTLDLEPPVTAEAAPLVFDIAFKPHRGLYDNGHEPLLLLDALAQLGPIDVTADLDGLPAFDAFDPAEAYLRWHITLTTAEPESALRDIFEFVDGLCDLSITPTGAAPDVPAIQEPQASPLDAAMAVDPEPLPTAPPDTVQAPTGGEPGSGVAAQSPAQRGPKPTLRVDLDRVDRLINTVGELIINQAMVSQRIEELDLPTGANLTNELEQYKLLARDIQEGVMAIRAQPVKPLFQRMSRIVREASDATEKKAKLVTVGDSTEVDKTVIERLADPLTHMIRNAVDHGLEKPDDRRAAGKDETGTIRLSAAHRSGSVFIEIADDGAGLDRRRILEKAIEKQLVPPEAELTEQEIDNLLFMPGFSTAGKVSNLSGRGVGMDVVKNAVQALGGRVSIQSTLGIGTTFTIVLPLTLAVMDGFVISVSDQTMVIPISTILETIRPRPKDIQDLGVDQQVINVRGAYVPIVDVAETLGLQQRGRKDGTGILLLVSSESHGLIALKVAGIRDQRQVVIKSLESNYTAIPGVSAATILGDGKIALILDPEELIRLAQASANLEALPTPTKLETRHA